MRDPSGQLRALSARLESAGACWRGGGLHTPDLAAVVLLARRAAAALCGCEDCARGCGALWRGLRAELDDGGRAPCAD